MTPRPFLLCVAILGLSSVLPASAKDSCKLLTIGNSFANDVTAYLPKLAEAAGKKILIYKANLGGHSLKRHAGFLELFQKDPVNLDGRPYPALASAGEKAGLPQALKSQEWDFVTIQQVSQESFNASTYEPFATQLIEEIRKDAPQAKILILQTWAYREDSSMFNKDFDQTKMYEGLKLSYEALAQRHGLSIIPVGAAFQAARATPEWKFTYPDPAFDYAKPLPDTAPSQPGSLNRGWGWRKKGDAPAKFGLDPKHANEAGRYLGACVFYEVLFGASVLDNTFVPEGLTPAQAAQLRQIAHEAVARNKQ